MIKDDKKAASEEESASINAPTESSTRLCLRADLLLMPLLTIAFGLQYLDKATLGSATLWGILADLDLSLPRYSQANACFYYGYLAAAFPMSFTVQRLKSRLNVFLGGMIILWGAILMLTGVVGSWRGLYAQRFFLGLIESAVSPGFVAITRQWYTKQEQPLRLGIWYSATGLFSIISGLLYHSLGEKKTSLATWQLIFLVPGAITIVFGFLLLLLLPSTPLGKPILSIPYYNRFSAAEKQELDAKVRHNLTGNERHGSGWSWSQAKEASMDPKIYIYLLMATSIYVVNGSVTVFGPILVKSIGYTSLRATLLLTPGGAVTAVSIYFFTFLASVKRLNFPFSRTVLFIVSTFPVMIGAAMCWKGDWTNKAVPLAGFYLLPSFGTPFVFLLGTATANIAGSTKQAIASGAIFVGYK
jgi:MFS family permease